jgi:hypothetical protein
MQVKAHFCKITTKASENNYAHFALSGAVKISVTQSGSMEFSGHHTWIRVGIRHCVRFAFLIATLPKTADRYVLCKFLTVDIGQCRT